MTRLRRLFPTVWVVLMLVAPVALWLSGERQPLLQNTPKEEFPAINRSSLTDPNTYRRFDAAMLDRFPLRGLALNVHGTIALEVFGESTNEQVAVGRNGWLYLVPELVPCVRGGRPVGDPADAADVLARTLVAAGYDTTVVIANAKQWVHEQDTPEIQPEAAARCVRAMERRIEARLAQAPGGLPINAEMRRLEARGEPTFLRTDSHWNWRGRELFARRVLDRIRPGLADEVGLRAGPAIAWPGNLTALLGLDRTEPDRAVVAERPPDRPLPPGDVVMIGDSQLGVSMMASHLPGKPSIHDQVLAGQPFCDWPELMDGRCDDRIRQARAIVFEKVSRDVLSLTLFCWRPVAIAGERLRGTAGGWASADGTPSPHDELTIPDEGFITVRVRPPSGDVSDVPRLLRLPIRRYVTPADGAATTITLTPQPRSGKPVACAMPSQSAPGGALFLPLPAGRPASDLVMRLQSAPGTRLGPPEEILLDGRRRTVQR